MSVESVGRRPDPAPWPFDQVAIVRHGETEWNVLRRRQGQLDSPLTRRGRDQARAMAATVTTMRADSVFSSPLGRARATAETISKALGEPVQVVDELREVDHGDMAGLDATEIDERWPGAMAHRERDKFDWRFPGGESYRDAAARARAALAVVASSTPRRPLIVTHEMVGRMLVG